MAAQKLLGGRYQFIQEIGSHDHSKTYLMADVHYPGHPRCIVKHLKLPVRNPVTLKFLASLLKKKIDMLETLSQHDRIPRVLAYFEDNQDFYVVQQYVVGRSLEQEFQKRQPWDEIEVIALLQEILEVLAFIQERGVIHRSIRPANIIRRRSDSHLVLIDFGLVKEINASMTPSQKQGMNGKSVEQSAFTAPEQVSGYPSFSTDHFALGMVALQAATGVAASALPRATQSDFEQSIEQCLKQAPDLNENLKAILRQLLHPNSEKRYQKAIEALADLRQIMQWESCPLETAPETPKEEPALVVNRGPSKRVQLGLGSLFLLGLVAGALLLRTPQKMMAAWWVNQGKKAEAREQVEEAISYFTSAYALDPQNVEALSQRSQIYLDQGSLEDALRDLTLALEQTPKNAQLYYQRANLRFQLGDLEGSITDYTEALKLDGSYTEAYINRGSARANLGDDQGAIEDYTTALKLDPDPETQAAAYLNRCLSRSNIDEQGAALEDCTQAINVRPNHSLAYENRGLVRRRINDLQGSLQDYTIAIQLNPSSPEPHYNRALTRAALGDDAGALADFNQALELHPDHVFAYYDRALLLISLGRIPQAMEDLEQASQKCLDMGRLGCFEDAQYQLNNLKQAP